MNVYRVVQTYSLPIKPMESTTNANVQPLNQTKWYYGWNVLAVAFFFQSITFGLTFYCLTFWIQPWMQEFNVGRNQVLLVVILIQVGMGLGGPFAGKAVDRFSTRWLIIIGILCYSLGLALTALATSLWFILLCYGTLIVVGNLFAGTLPSQTLAVRWFPASRGAAIGLVSVGTSFGGFVLPIIIAQLVDQYGWRDTNLILAIAMPVLVIPLVWLVIRNSPADMGLTPKLGPQVTDTTANIRRQLDFKRWTTTAVFKERSFWLLSCALVSIATAFSALAQNLAPLADDLGLSSQNASFLVSTMALVMMLGKFFFGFLADRVDHRYLFWLANSAAIAALTLLTFAPLSYPLMFLVSGVTGFSCGSILPLMGAAVSSRFGATSFAHVTGLLGMCMIIAAMGPWLAGYLRDIQGSYAAAWTPILAMLALSMIAIAFLPKQSPS